MRKILLVEDSKVVNKLLSGALTEAGYEVISCYDVESAITALQGDALGIKLVITDMIMPGKDGNDLIDHIHQNALGTRPKILAISGGSKETVTGETAVGSVQARVERILTKPFKQEVLITLVKDLIGPAA